MLKLARRKIEKALDLAPDLYLGHEFYGIYFNMLGEPEEALQHHRESIRLNEDDGWPYADYANSLRAVSRYQEAIHALGEALKIEPTNPIFHRNLGLMFHDQGEIVEAEEHYSAPRYHAERHRKTLLFPSTDTYESPPKLAC